MLNQCVKVLVRSPLFSSILGPHWYMKSFSYFFAPVNAVSLFLTSFGNTNSDLIGSDYTYDTDAKDKVIKQLKLALL
jgi:hypothetical protein